MEKQKPSTNGHKVIPDCQRCGKHECAMYRPTFDEVLCDLCNNAGLAEIMGSK